jgi:hypothetical protein
MDLLDWSLYPRLRGKLEGLLDRSRWSSRDMYPWQQCYYFVMGGILRPPLACNFVLHHGHGASVLERPQDGTQEHAAHILSQGNHRTDPKQHNLANTSMNGLCSRRIYYGISLVDHQVPGLVSTIQNHINNDSQLDRVPSSSNFRSRATMLGRQSSSIGQLAMQLISQPRRSVTRSMSEDIADERMALDVAIREKHAASAAAFKALDYDGDDMEEKIDEEQQQPELQNQSQVVDEAEAAPSCMFGKMKLGNGKAAGAERHASGFPYKCKTFAHPRKERPLQRWNARDCLGVWLRSAILSPPGKHVVLSSAARLRRWPIKPCCMLGMSI